MTPTREDPELVLPRVPSVVPLLAPPDGPAVIAGSARDADFSLAGEMARVRGSQRGALTGVWMGGRRVAAEVTSDLGVAANLVVTPGVARREFVGAGGGGIESVVAAPTMPFVAIQWQRAVPGRSTSVSVALTPGISPARYLVGPDSMVVAGRDGEVIGLGVSPVPDRLRVREDVSTHEVVVEVEGTGAFTLMLSAGPPDQVQRSLAACAHLAGHARRATDPGSDTGLRMETGVQELDEGFLWARARLRAALGRTPTHVPLQALREGLAASGIGDVVSANRALALLGPESSAKGALLAGRIAAVFGQQQSALRHAHQVASAGETESWAGDPLGPLALDALADGLRYAAPESLITCLREIAATRSRPAAGRRLPMLGGAGGEAADTGLPAWLRSLLAGEPALGVWAEDPEERRALGEAVLSDLGAMDRACARFREDPDAAWTIWRASLAEGLASGPDGPGSWDASDPSGEALAPVAASVLGAVAYGLLGMAPDAPSGRLRLAPRWPSHLTRFRAVGIVVGDASMAIDYERDGGSHRYALTPERAGVPPMLIFEPVVHGRVSEIRIDGAVADLETRRVGSATTVPCQLPLDGPRSVEIRTV